VAIGRPQREGWAAVALSAQGPSPKSWRAFSTPVVSIRPGAAELMVTFFKSLNCEEIPTSFYFKSKYAQTTKFTEILTRRG